MLFKRVSILDSQLNVFDGIGTVRESIKGCIKNNKAGYICVSNVHTVVMGAQDINFQKITNESLMSITDGVPLVWGIKLLAKENAGRCAGPDLMEEFLKHSSLDGLSHYFYGSTDEVLNLMIDKIKKKYPDLNIAGYYSPPFRSLSDEEKKLINENIKRANPDIIWVGLGAPKQEVWMKENWKNLNSIMIGVGAAFDFFAETKKRAPMWMQKSGLEWLFRLISEPKRLFKRYLLT
ncbi:MAG TPA: WecB/TagA/CpsF family glycosyltransferase, partial [Clostridia bacterium]